MYRLRKSKNAEDSAEVCEKCESYVRNIWLLSASKPTRP